MKLRDILTTYFSQLLVLLGAVGSLLFYFIKRCYDLSSRKIEIKFKLFLQNKLLAVQEFINCYKVLEQTYTDLSYHKVVKNTYTTSEMDEMTRPPINKLHSAYSHLFLYFKPNELKLFEKVHSSSVSMHSTITRFYFDSSPDNHSREISNLGMSVVSFQTSNARLLEEIGMTLRKEFDN